MWDLLLKEMGGRGFAVVLGMLLGGISTGFVAYARRRRERQNVMRGDARDTVIIAQHVIDTINVPATDQKPAHKAPRSLRIRSLGQSELSRVIPNGHLATELMHRVVRVTSSHTLISMDGAEGSYLLETLTNFVCDRVANAPFDHNLYVMAPCCEPAGIAVHQPITILLIAVQDLALFEDWPTCREVHVEHSADGARVLTLMELARRFKEEQRQLAQLRQAGQRTRYLETMYILDLALDARCAAIPAKPVPWGRFEDVLKEMNLE